MQIFNLYCVFAEVFSEISRRLRDSVSVKYLIVGNVKQVSVLSFSFRRVTGISDFISFAVYDNSRKLLEIVILSKLLNKNFTVFVTKTIASSHIKGLVRIVFRKGCLSPYFEKHKHGTPQIVVICNIYI